MGSPGGRGRVVEDSRGNAQGRPHATPPGAGLKQLLPDLATRCGPNAVRERRRRPEPEPAVAGDRDESRGGEEPRTVQGRGCVQQALRDFTNERNGGWRRTASTACLERGWQESQRTRQRTGSTTSKASPREPASLEGRSTRSQHGSSSGGSRVVHGIQECVRELPDRGVHGQPVVREHDHGVSAKRGAEARLRAGGVLPAPGLLSTLSGCGCAQRGRPRPRAGLRRECRCSQGPGGVFGPNADQLRSPQSGLRVERD